MADIYQHAEVDTLHFLGPNARLRDELRDYEGRIHVNIPSLYDELHTPAFQGIIEQLPELDYLDKLVVVLNGLMINPDDPEGERIPTTQYQFDEFRERLSGLPYETRVVWDNSDGMRDFLRSLEGKELSLGNGEPGKGKAVHLGNGYSLGTDANEIVHQDADIITYSPEMIDRLAYASAILNNDFAKAFYGRYKGKLYGRVCRDFVAPLIQVLLEMEDVKKVPKAHAFLKYLEGFRYALSGENAQSADYAMKEHIASDWAIEINQLADAYKLCGPHNICQVEIMEGPYDHKHQEICRDERNKGLHRMAREISKSLLRNLVRKHRVVLTPSHYRTIREAFIEKAYGFIHRYEDDARINGLPFNMHEEKTMIDTFSEALGEAEHEIYENLGVDPTLSSWGRILSADSSAIDRLVDVVERDNRKAA